MRGSDESAIVAAIIELANARTGKWSKEWVRREHDENRIARVRVFCRLCDELITTEQPENHRRTDSALGTHARRHVPAIQYVIDNDLHILDQKAMDELFGRSWGALIKGNIFPKIGVVQVFQVMVGPKWVAAVMHGWMEPALQLRVIQWASRYGDFKDALVAAADLPDEDGVGMLVASQFWEELQRKAAKDLEE